MKISKDQLVGACREQVEKFAQLFGDEAEVTEELCVQHAADFDFDWAARKLLSAAAWAEYERVRAPALAEYQRVTAPAWAEYQRVSAAAWAEYQRVRAPALAEYERVRAATFARLYAEPRGES